MRKILRQPLLNAPVAACGVIDKSDPTPTLPRPDNNPIAFRLKIL